MAQATTTIQGPPTGQLLCAPGSSLPLSQPHPRGSPFLVQPPPPAAGRRLYVTLSNCLSHLCLLGFPCILSGFEPARARVPATCRGDDKVPVPAGTMRGPSGLNEGLLQAALPAPLRQLSFSPAATPGASPPHRNQHHEPSTRQEYRPPRQQGAVRQSKSSPHQQ